MDKKKNGVVDISPFLLVEGSADSQSDCELLKLCEDVIMACDYADEDAESCSCDAVGFLEVFDSDGTGADQAYSDFDEANKEYCPDDPNWCRVWLGVAGLEYASSENGEEDSKVGGTKWSKEVMDQMEDSLFWETCLAIGYP